MRVYCCARGNRTESFDNRLTFPGAVFYPYAPPAVVFVTPRPVAPQHARSQGFGVRNCVLHCLQLLWNMWVAQRGEREANYCRLKESGARPRVRMGRAKVRRRADHEITVTLIVMQTIIEPFGHEIVNACACTGNRGTVFPGSRTVGAPLVFAVSTAAGRC